MYSGGPSLVIAGAGSGKTRVLTYKIAYLLASGDYSPYQILALTFTNKAAREMKERIASVVGGATASRLWMGTFHSIFSRILRTNAERIGFSRDFTIYDQSDSRSLIKTVIKEMSLDDKVYKPATVQAIISNAKNALITPSAYAANAALIEADMRSKRPLIRDIYKRQTYIRFIGVVVPVLGRWISMICCFIPISFSETTPMCWSFIRISSGMFWSMSIRIPILHSILSSISW